MNFRPLFPGCLSVLASAGALLIAGCSSEPPPDRAAGPMVVPDFPPALMGAEPFAEGRIAVEVTLGLPAKFRPGEDRGPRAGEDKAARHSGKPRGGLSLGGNDMGLSDNGGRPGGYTGSGEGPPPDLQPLFTRESPRMSAMGSNLPPAQLKLRLRNTSASDSVACEVVDFKSYLGDFAVYPAKYQIAPGETAASEMMTSRLGVSGGEIAVTVALRVNGQVERKVVTLHALKPAEPTTGTPAPKPAA